MHFLVLTTDRPGRHQQYLAQRPAHIAYWEANTARVMLAGAMLASGEPGAPRKGSMLIVAADSRAEVEALLAGDPFVIHAVYEDAVRIEPLRLGMGAWFPR